MAAAIPLIITGVSAGIGAWQKWKAGKKAKEAGLAQKAAADDQAELIDFNAHIADEQAKDAEERGQIEEARLRQGTTLQVASTRAGYAGQNIDIFSGSALQTQADQVFMGELDAHTIKTNTAREAWGYKVQGYDLRKQAEIRRKEGINAAAAGVSQQNALRWGAVGDVIGAGGSIYAARYGFGSTGTQATSGTQRGGGTGVVMTGTQSGQRTAADGDLS